MAKYCSDGTPITIDWSRVTLSAPVDACGTGLPTCDPFLIAVIEAARELRSAIPACRCIPGYRDRDLLDPQCAYHEVGDEEIHALDKALDALEHLEDSRTVTHGSPDPRS